MWAVKGVARNSLAMMFSVGASNVDLVNQRHEIRVSLPGRVTMRGNGRTRLRLIYTDGRPS